ncbi:MAG: DUF6034 family protein [Clostridia bacterium]
MGDEGSFSLPATKAARLIYSDNREGKISDCNPQKSQIVTGEKKLREEAKDYLEMTPVEAQIAVTQKLEGLGICASVFDVLLVEYESKSMKTDISEKAISYCYNVRCSSMIGGSQNVFFKTALEVSDDNYGDVWGQWGYEQISILLDDEGIYRLEWVSPHEIEEVVVDKAQLLPFDSIQTIFNTFMNATYSCNDDSDLAETRIEITEVYLGLQRIAEENSIKNGLLVPMWCFYGVEHRISSDGNENLYDSQLDGRPLLVINAIDGTIIDPSKGY